MRRGVVFDFDGVLADSEGLHLAAFQDVLTARGWTLARSTYFDRYLGFDDRDLLQAFFADHEVQVPAAELDAIVAEKGRKYDARVQGGHILFPAAAACVARLGVSFALGIASGSLHEEIADILRANHLEQAFAVVVGADDVARSKPAPDPYATAVQRLGIRPEDAVAIEDSHWGLTSAVAAGLRTIAVTTSYPRHALQSAGAVVDSLDEVTPELITRLLAVR
ncbi:MAG TPA: HAD family phosphatase [Vicinamibacterales bacterium]|nr:HAD family phosphatase [Vicinamibacterales bacterium]